MGSARDPFSIDFGDTTIAIDPRYRFSDTLENLDLKKSDGVRLVSAGSGLTINSSSWVLTDPGVIVSDESIEKIARRVVDIIRTEGL